MHGRTSTLAEGILGRDNNVELREIHRDVDFVQSWEEIQALVEMVNKVAMEPSSVPEDGLSTQMNGNHQGNIEFL